VEELGIPELTNEQIEELCTIAEATAREYVYSKVPKKNVEKLGVSTEVKDSRPVNLTVEVDINLSPSMKDFEVQDLAKAAVNEAFQSAEKYLRKLACRSQK